MLRIPQRWWMRVLGAACLACTQVSTAHGEALIVAKESFADRGPYPLELEHLGPPGQGWGSSWQRWRDLAPVFVEPHTINNPFGSGHGSSERASNHGGQVRASQRRLGTKVGEPGTRVEIAFALMEYTAANQDGQCGGIQLLRDGEPVLYCGRAVHAPQFALGPAYDAPTERLCQTTLAVARPGELYGTHYFRLVIEYGATADRACLEPYDMYGLPTAEPVSVTAADLSFDALAVVLDDYQLDELVVSREGPADRSPVHYRPSRIGRLADTIPFFWNGEYHIFYLRAVGKVPWEHIVSRDLVHWRECPTAIVADGDEQSADGLNMFTGSVIAHEGTFHMYYVGWNPRNPEGREFILHAVSEDLMTWTKVPADRLAPDGVRYSAARERDFRDPYVIRDPAGDRFWMFFCAERHTGVSWSRDLRHWEFADPLQSAYDGLGTPECPDLFTIGEHTYLLVSPIDTKHTMARVADDWRSAFVDIVGTAIDTPYLYAAKRLWDGRRHVLTGWLRDLDGQRDDGAFLWGGTQCVPRELTAGSDPRELRVSPVAEAVAAFGHVAVDVMQADPAGLRHDGRWRRAAQQSWVGTADGEPARMVVDAPANYLLACRFTPSADAEVTVTFRMPGEDVMACASGGGGYRLQLAADRGELRGAHFRSARPIVLRFGEPVTLTAFVVGTTLECFVNDAFAFSCRAYDFREGPLCVEVTRGRLTMDQLQLRTYPPPGREAAVRLPRNVQRLGWSGSRS